jgi:hypothetical protein
MLLVQATVKMAKVLVFGNAAVMLASKKNTTSPNTLGLETLPESLVLQTEKNIKWRSPIWSSVEYSFGWRERKQKHVLLMEAKFKYIKEHPSPPCENSSHLPQSPSFS